MAVRPRSAAPCASVTGREKGVEKKKKKREERTRGDPRVGCSHSSERANSKEFEEKKKKKKKKGGKRARESTLRAYAGSSERAWITARTSG